MAATKYDWQQGLFDLMANEKVKVVIVGEVGEVDAELHVYEQGRWELVGTTINHESMEEALTDLLQEYEDARLNDGR